MAVTGPGRAGALAQAPVLRYDAEVCAARAP